MQTTSHQRSPADRRRPVHGRRSARPVLFAVEDDPATLELIRDVAADAGWASLGFSRLAEFERAMAEAVPDFVILDDELPDGRGGDRARELRRDGRLRHLPVLVCTAATPRRRAEIGVWAPVLAKPFDLGEIERLLDVTARSRRLEAHRPPG